MGGGARRGRSAFAFGFGATGRQADRSSVTRWAAFVDAFWIRQRDVADLQTIDDLRHGWRQMRQHGGFAFTAIAILALSMAASVIAFSVVSQMLLRPLPYPDDRAPGHRLGAAAHSPARLEVAPANFLDWRARSQSFTHLAAGDP